jgi:hypothetical protein
MLDTTTYLLTQDHPGGPIVQLEPADYLHDDLEVQDTDEVALSAWVVATRLVCFAAMAATGLYLAYGI